MRRINLEFYTLEDFSYDFHPIYTGTSYKDFTGASITMTIDTYNATVSGSSDGVISFEVPSGDLEPGIYSYRIVVDDGTVPFMGEIKVKRVVTQ